MNSQPQESAALTHPLSSVIPWPTPEKESNFSFPYPLVTAVPADVEVVQKNSREKSEPGYYLTQTLTNPNPNLSHS
eukprot:1394954-Amorphochlora_amoeboformis.AAC.2